MDVLKSNVSATSNDDIQKILALNTVLAGFGLTLPTLATNRDVAELSQLAKKLPESESAVISHIEEMVLEPRIRAMQNVGRHRELAPFKPFGEVVEAATICFYRDNFIGAFFTLVPVVEGILLRWSEADDATANFKLHRRFFAQGHSRHPCPANPLFYDVYARACDRIVNDHLYKHTDTGRAHADFNRHYAAHLIEGPAFANRANCVRLFLLLDTMSELYYYETRCRDPRWYLEDQHFVVEESLYRGLLMNQVNPRHPERILLRRARGS